MVHRFSFNTKLDGLNIILTPSSKVYTSANREASSNVLLALVLIETMEWSFAEVILMTELGRFKLSPISIFLILVVTLKESKLPFPSN